MNRAQHVSATVALAVALFPLGAADPDLFLVAGGVSLGLILHPDLDQSNTPYGAVRAHRGLSHWPVFGTLDRVLWFLGPLLLAWFLTGRPFDWLTLWIVLAGLCAADGLHILMDELEGGR